MLQKLTDGGSIACIASGPSLTVDDVNALRGVMPVIAINDAVRLAPWADILYSSDSSWWARHQFGKTFTGPCVKVSASQFHLEKAKHTGLIILKNTGERGLELTPWGLRTGKNSGSAAINLAVHCGAKRIILLGYDMGTDAGRNHFYDTQPTASRSPYQMFRKLLASMSEPLVSAGIDVVNCSRRTNLECFRRATLAEELCARPVPANV